MEAGTSRKAEVTDEELREAEVGLVRLLHKKRFPREWIERHVPDVMAQARTEFAARLVAGKKDDTVNLLVVIGWRRAIKVLRSELAGPPTTSIENVFHLADEGSPTPEEEVIERDRQERIVKAMGYLPERDRRLLALHYFSGMSIREAGRKLGWGKSAADRHHQAALERLHAMLDRSLLAPEIAIPAFVASRHHSAPRAVAMWIQGAGETVRDVVLLRSGHASSIAEAANAAASSGGGRTAAGLCGAAVTICLAGATGVIGPGLSRVGVDDSHQIRTSHPATVDREHVPPPRQGAVNTAERSPTSQTSESARRKGTTVPRQESKKTSQPLPERSRSQNSTAPSPATQQQTVNEFGVEQGAVKEAAQPNPEATENTPIAPTSEPARPSGEPSGGGGGGGGGGSSGGSTSSEFGM